MAKLQFYKNKYYYPHYSESLISYGTSLDCTPVGMNLRSGTLRVKGDMTDFMSCNYLAFTRDFQTLYAWIDDVKFRTEDSFEVTYTVDAWRTYKGKVSLGTQYIKRSPLPTNKPDHLLGSTSAVADVTTLENTWATTERVLVVQATPEPAYVANNTPVQPTPYHFYFTSYNPDNWQASAVLTSFFGKLRGSSAISNIITMYSLPFMNIGTLPSVALPLFEGDEQVDTVEGFKFLSGTNDVKNLLTRSKTIDIGVTTAELTRTAHTVQLLVPEAGIMNIPDEYLAKPNLRLRQDVDLFSGASNYILTYDTDNKLSGVSIRGASTSSIPVISNPYDTYISQNQNALTTSLIGDVASVAIGAGTFLMAPNMVSGSVALKGVSGLVGDYAQHQDMKNASPSNPPSFLGTAMANHFHAKFFVIVKRPAVTNTTAVRGRYGYPYEMVDTLTLPTSGYIETQDCSVTSTDGSVPRWALEEINGNFNSGIHVH